MNIRFKYLFFIGTILQLQIPLSAQKGYQFGSLPSLNINKKLKKDWSLNVKLESRQLFQHGETNGIAERYLQYDLTDVSMIVAKKVGLNARIAGGYLIRSERDHFIHRSVQQFALVQTVYGRRIVHRIMSDQTFSKTEKPNIRLRYRIAAEFPLSGEFVDPGEFYLKLNNEYLNSLQARVYDLEIRLIPLLGYDISDDVKIELGLDYRINSFVDNNTRQRYWMTFNVFVEI